MPQELNTIGIIGAGSIGSALARLAFRAGLDVYLSNSRDPESLRELAASIGPTVATVTASHVAEHADVIFAAIPLGRYRELQATSLAGKIVVDTMNYYPGRDGRMPELDADSITSSALLQRHLPESNVVKGLNNLDYVRLEILARPEGAADRSAVPIAGDDEAAKAAARYIIGKLGYDTVGYGSLAESRRSQPGSPVYVAPYQPARTSAQSGRGWSAEWFLTRRGVTVPTSRVVSLLQAATG